MLLLFSLFWPEFLVIFLTKHTQSAKRISKPLVYRKKRKEKVIVSKSVEREIVGKYKTCQYSYVDLSEIYNYNYYTIFDIMRKNLSSQERKEIKRKLQSGERNAFYGKTHTKESLKISKAMVGNKNAQKEK